VGKNVVPVSDCAAIIKTMGEGVDGFKVGDRVVVAFDGTNQYGPQRDWNHGHGGPVDGFLRRYAVVPAVALVKIPESSKLGYPQLASLVCTGTTAWNSLFGPVAIRPGQTILVQGELACPELYAIMRSSRLLTLPAGVGTGGVSMTVLILAKAFGCTVIVTSSSDDKLKLGKEKYGADFGINYKKVPKWGEEAHRLTGGVGVDVVIENGGVGTIEQSFQAIKMGGMIALIGFLAAPQGQIPDVTGLTLGKSAIVRGIAVGAKQYLEELVEFVCARGLEIPVDKVFPFEEALEAYRYLQSGSHVGKVCIDV
jgi:NADPH:quinone reductase-like Zn-dependent oxidoreductase